MRCISRLSVKRMSREMKAAVIVAAGPHQPWWCFNLRSWPKDTIRGKRRLTVHSEKTYKLADCWCCDHARIRATEESQERADVYLSHSMRVVNSVKISTMRTWYGGVSNKIVVPSDLEPFHFTSLRLCGDTYSFETRSFITIFVARV
jgi:hypothetical protein